MAMRTRETNVGDTKKLIWKNIIVISFSFVLLFTSFNSVATLQSSINQDLGTMSLSVLYVSLVLSCLFVPSWLINMLHEKKTITLCMLGYSLYIAAQFYPIKATVIPGAIIVGICAAPLWSAKCTYLTKAAKEYGAVANLHTSIVVNRFFGIFFLFFQSSNIWGNLISSTVLKFDSDPVLMNDTDRLSQCGADYCQDDVAANSTLHNDLSTWQKYTMVGIFLVFSLLSALSIWIFVDPISSLESEPQDNEKQGDVSLFIATIKHFINDSYQMFIFPLTIWSGMEQAFFGADFTAAYITCGEGVYMVGYVVMVYGAADALGSILFTLVIKITGRLPVLTLGGLLNYGAIAFFLYWKPSPDDKFLFYIFAAVWGIADSIWQTQINAFYGVLFYENSEAAFSNYRLWESIGFAVAYFCSTMICVDFKLYILLIILSFGLIGYYIIEINERFHIVQTQRSKTFVLKQ